MRRVEGGRGGAGTPRRERLVVCRESSTSCLFAPVLFSAYHGHCDGHGGGWLRRTRTMIADRPLSVRSSPPPLSQTSWTLQYQGACHHLCFVRREQRGPQVDSPQSRFEVAITELPETINASIYSECINCVVLDTVDSQLIRAFPAVNASRRVKPCSIRQAIPSTPPLFFPSFFLFSEYTRNQKKIACLPCGVWQTMYHKLSSRRMEGRPTCECKGCEGSDANDVDLGELLRLLKQR